MLDMLLLCAVCLVAESASLDTDIEYLSGMYLFRSQFHKRTGISTQLEELS